ncbi:MAG: PTS transporter subunit EIIA [Alphaproteobacteria bacterium]|jgi:PTS system nitrogen regulatory IIA component|nr:PTS transporter subunit EIIA [Alphaproteobacteria bacterium]
MQLADVLAVDRIAIDLSVSSKKSLLEKASELLASASEGADARQIFESLCQRERLGSTGLGHGVAIPHGRVSGQAGVVAALIRLRTPIDFDAPDQDRVDLFFALAVPDQCSDVYLRLLADIAERLGDGRQRERLRSADEADELLRFFSEVEGDPAA